MKSTSFLIFFLNSFICFSQIYITRDAEIYFLSDADALEIIEAKNSQVSAVIDFDNKKIAFQVPLRGFNFKISLMEEHFNENYVESDKFPNATFIGFYQENLDDLFSKNNVEINGEMDFHGIKKKMKIRASFKKSGEIIEGLSKFNLLCSDFNIKIPKIVSNKINNTVNVKVNAKFKKK